VLTLKYTSLETQLKQHQYGCSVVSSVPYVSSQVKSSLRLFRAPLTQTQRGLQDHKKKFTKQNK